MTHYCLVRGRLNKIVSLAAVVLLTVIVSRAGAQPQAAPIITVTVNKSMVFRLAERAKRVSVSQPQVADVRHAWQLSPAVRSALPHEWMKTAWDRWAETQKLGDTLEDRYSGFDIRHIKAGEVKEHASGA